MTFVDLKSYFHSLSPLQPDSTERLAALFREKHLQKHEYFAKEGRIETQIAFLSDGVVRAFYRTASGVEYNKHFFTAPTILGGYSSLITGRINQINQQALTDCTLWVADYSAITDLYAHHPDLERLGRRNAELAFVEKEQREIELVLLDADERYDIFRKQYPTLESIIPQYHIASYLGVTPTQLSRIRRKRARL